MPHIFIAIYFTDIHIILEDDDYESFSKIFSAYFRVAGGIGRLADFFVGNSEMSEILKKIHFTESDATGRTWTLFS